MDGIARHLFDLGYKPSSAKLYISRLGRFSEFLGHNARSTVISQGVIDRFMLSLHVGSPRVAARTVIEHARSIVPDRFSTPARRVIADPDGPLLAAYLDHLRHVRGLEPKTCEGILKGARRILTWLRDHLPGQPFSAITGEHVLALMQHLLSLSANHYTRSATTSYTRGFLRFLRWSELNGQDLARFVPRTPCWRLAHLPPRLSWQNIQRAIDAIDISKPSGTRDKAIMLMLATTGLRNRELRVLELQDIHWRTAEVIVRRTKGKRDRVVPLLDEAGAALADYILHARPRVVSTLVFLSSFATGAPFQMCCLNFTDRPFALEQGGVELSGPAGAHLLRHSLATQLVQQRRPINEVADLLGHRSIDTTAIYVKVAVPQSPGLHCPFREACHERPL